MGASAFDESITFAKNSLNGQAFDSLISPESIEGPFALVSALFIHDLRLLVNDVTFLWL